MHVGDGSMVLCWKDLWQDQMLDMSHPRVFSFARDVDVSMASFLSMATLPEGFYLPLSSQAREEV